ncbi:MAG: thioesterase family protein [Gordonia sp. (in: high G+C Gram-positive bacteria)]
MAEKLAELLSLRVSAASRAAVSGGPDVVYTANIDPVFTIGPKVHGGSMQMLIAHAARTAFAELVPEKTAQEKTAQEKTAQEKTAQEGVSQEGVSQEGVSQGDAGGATELVPVAISSDYLSAPDPAEVELAVTVRKRGRTVSLLHVDLRQGGRTMVSSSVTLARLDTGRSRHSASTVLDALPIEPPPDGIHIDNSPISEAIHLGPALDLVLDPESFPALRGETGEPLVRGWVRPKAGEPDSGFAVLVCDVSPPVVMNLAFFGWAPTVQLTTYVRRQPVGGWLRFAATSSEVGPAMFEEDHLVVDSSGAVVAQSRQLALLPQPR